MLLLLAMLLGALPPGTLYFPGENEGGPGQTRCPLREGIDINRGLDAGQLWGPGVQHVAMCPGLMSEECCCRWVRSANKPACAGADAGVPVS